MIYSHDNRCDIRAVKPFLPWPQTFLVYSTSSTGDLLIGGEGITTLIHNYTFRIKRAADMAVDAFICDTDNNILYYLCMGIGSSIINYDFGVVSLHTPLEIYAGQKIRTIIGANSALILSLQITTVQDVYR